MMVWVIFSLYMINHDDDFEQKRYEHWSHSHYAYYEGGFYGNPNAHLIYGILPAVDFSKGGVYFFGDSVMASMLGPMDKLDPDSARLHNYCQLGQTFTDEFQFIRYLVEEEGIVRSARKNTCFVIGVDFSNALHDWTLHNDLWSHVFTNTGLYAYDVNSGISNEKMTSWWRSLRIIQIRIQLFSHWAFSHFHLPAEARTEDPITTWNKNFGPDWEHGLDDEVSQFNSLIDYLKKNNINFKIVYLPEKTWSDAYVPAQRFRQAVVSTLTTHGVEMIDMLHSLNDEDFSGTDHISYSGSQKLCPVIFDYAHKFLRNPTNQSAQ